MGRAEGCDMPCFTSVKTRLTRGEWALVGAVLAGYVVIGAAALGALYWLWGIGWFDGLVRTPGDVAVLVFVGMCAFFVGAFTSAVPGAKPRFTSARKRRRARGSHGRYS